MVNLMKFYKLNEFRDRLSKRILDYFFANYISDKFYENSVTKPLIWGPIKNLKSSDTVVLNNALINLSCGKVTIGEYAFFGHNVSLLTGTHDYNKFNLERQLTVPSSGQDIVIEQGVWIATNATIIAPCVIGKHSVVAACSLVKSDVPPFSVVAGIPATVVKSIKPNLKF